MTTLVVVTMKGCQPCSFYKENTRNQLIELAEREGVPVAEIEMAPNARAVLSDSSKGEHIYVTNSPDLNFPYILLISTELAQQLSKAKPESVRAAFKTGRKLCIFNRKPQSLTAVETPVMPSYIAVKAWFEESKMLLTGATTADYDNQYRVAVSGNAGNSSSYNGFHASCAFKTLTITQKKQ